VLLVALALPLPRNGAIAGLPPVCGFRLVTGLPCPGCGFTRSVVSCAHGQWDLAVGYHPLGPLVFAALLAVAGFGVLQLAQPARAGKLVERLAGKRSLWISTTSGFAVALAAIWLARLTGWMPSPL